MNLPDTGLIAVVKRDCQTCEMTEPVLAALASSGALTVYTQDDPAFPESVPHLHDASLDISHGLKIEVVPTLLMREGGREVARTFGWNKSEWREITGISTLGEDLPDLRPGCGAKNIEPGIIEDLLVRHGETGLKSRRVELGTQEDEIEALFDRGWSDGLPLVPPTEARVLRMLGGTARDPNEVIGQIPSDLADCTVEKVAINAVMAGCKPEYLPVVLAAVEAVLEEPFAMHGVLATTMFVGPVVIVNGPIRRAIGMNAKGNALGQGFRANNTIGRALQLVIRNVGGGRPQEVDRATLGNPGKLTYCIAEDEEGSCWESLACRASWTRNRVIPRASRSRLRSASRPCSIPNSTLVLMPWSWSAPSTNGPIAKPVGARHGSTRNSMPAPSVRRRRWCPAPVESRKGQPPSLLVAWRESFATAAS
jgi:hypothetical protein